MSNEQEKINRWFRKYGWNHQTFFNRPHATRRHFLELLGSGVTASFLAQHPAKAAEVAAAGASSQGNGAERDLHSDGRRPQPHRHVRPQDVNGVTAPQGCTSPHTINGIYFPTGLMPKLAALAGDFAIARSVRAHAVVHSVSQTWVQIGRNPLAALGNIAPNIGSIVAAEKFGAAQTVGHLPHVPGAELQWRGEPGLPVGQIRAVQSDALARPASATPPIPPAKPASRTASSCSTRWTAACATNAPNGAEMSDYNEFYIDAKQLMYNPEVNQYFGYTAAAEHGIRQHRHGQRHAGGLAGLEGEPGHALHSDHQQRWLGHALQHLCRRRQPCRPGPKLSTTGCPR